MNTIKNKCLVLLAISALSMPLAAQGEKDAQSDTWLPSLKTETPQEGFELAITLARKGVTSTQSNKEVLFREREEYSQDADSLIHASEVIATYFQTVAAANDYWK